MSRNFGLRLRPSTPTSDSLNPYALFEPSVAKMGGVTVRDVDVSVLRLLRLMGVQPVWSTCVWHIVDGIRVRFWRLYIGNLVRRGHTGCCCVGRSKILAARWKWSQSEDWHWGVCFLLDDDVMDLRPSIEILSRSTGHTDHDLGKSLPCRQEMDCLWKRTDPFGKLRT